MAEVADRGFVALGKVLDELMRVCHFRGFDNAGEVERGVAARNVVGDSIVENEIVLQDCRDLGSQRIEGDLADVLSVDADLAMAGVENTR